MLKKMIFTLALVAVVAMIGITSLLLVGGLDIQSANTREARTAAPNREAPALKDTRKVAILIHEGVELLDFSGPGEVFASANHRQAFEVYTVAASPGDILSQGFVTIKPQYTFANCPPPDIVILPGGRTDVPLTDPAVLKWIKDSSQRA